MRLDLHTAATLSFLPARLTSLYFSTVHAAETNTPLHDSASPGSGPSLELHLEAACGTGVARLQAALRRAEREARAALERAERLGIVTVPFGSRYFPTLLTHIPDPPPLLWVKGSLDALLRPAVAIVGSRYALPSSLDVASQLANGLAAAGVAVVSGLARGVDGAAHRGALEAGLSIGVLGSGLDRIYPSEHRTLADAMERQGAVVSELAPGTPPRPWHFPSRNRLISGISLGVVVIEASEKSGSLITARLALEQGREVMAVPGAVRGGRNRGGHALIRDGARLVEEAADVLEELSLPAAAGASSPGVDGDTAPLRRGHTVTSHAAVLDCLEVGETYDLQTIIDVCRCSTSQALQGLLALELAGNVVRTPGGRFYRPSRAMVR